MTHGEGEGPKICQKSVTCYLNGPLRNEYFYNSAVTDYRLQITDYSTFFRLVINKICQVVFCKNHMALISSQCTLVFFAQKCFVQLFSSYVLVKKALSCKKRAWIKCLWNWHMVNWKQVYKRFFSRSKTFCSIGPFK